MSPHHQRTVPAMAARYGFDVEFVTYKWPHWLHKQTDKQRIIWWGALRGGGRAAGRGACFRAAAPAPRARRAKPGQRAQRGRPLANE